MFTSHPAPPRFVLMPLALALVACASPTNRQFAVTECSGISLSDIHPILPMTAEPMEAPLAVVGGTPPYEVALLEGAPPDGLELEPTGAFVGRAVETGIYPMRLRIDDARGESAELPIVVEVVMPETEVPRILQTRFLSEEEANLLVADPNWAEMIEGLARHDLSPALGLAMLSTVESGGVVEVTIVPTVTAAGEPGPGVLTMLEPGNPEAFAFAAVLLTDDAGAITGMRWYGGGGGVIEIGLSSSLYALSVTTISAGISGSFVNLESWFFTVFPALPWWQRWPCATACRMAHTGSPMALMPCVVCLGLNTSACGWLG